MFPLNTCLSKDDWYSTVGELLGLCLQGLWGRLPTQHIKTLHSIFIQLMNKTVVQVKRTFNIILRAEKSLHSVMLTWLWIRVCGVPPPFSTTIAEVWKRPSLSCWPGKAGKITKRFEICQSLWSPKTLRCLDGTETSEGFSPGNPLLSVSDYWLSQEPNLWG